MARRIVVFFDAENCIAKISLFIAVNLSHFFSLAQSSIEIFDRFEEWERINIGSDKVGMKMIIWG